MGRSSGLVMNLLARTLTYTRTTAMPYTRAAEDIQKALELLKPYKNPRDVCFIIFTLHH